MKRLGIDRSLPCGVVQWSGLIAINYPARKFGITRHESFEEVGPLAIDDLAVLTSDAG